MSQSVDPKAYYGYLFEVDKKPTKVLDALLRGIALHIVSSIGNAEDKSLSPAKLASFYKAVGGNYDSLFVDVPPQSISWIYASIGCQHTLQPDNNDFQPPSIPALTIRGFVRWQSIEILLGPEEHVPFIQNAVRNFAIKNPDTGEPFPVDLPKEAFPLKPDPEIEKWHSSCAERLRLEARGDDEASRPDLPPRPKVQAGFKHVQPRRPAHSHSPGRSPRSRPEVTEYFEPVRQPIQFKHVSSQHINPDAPIRPKLTRSPSHRANQFLAPEVDRLSRPRRRSLPDNGIPSPTTSPAVQPVYPPIPPPSNIRPHSHPRPYRAPSISTASESSDSEKEVPPRRHSQGTHHARLSQRESDEPPIRVTYSHPSTHHQRANSRPEASSSDERRPGERRKSWAPSIPIDLSGKLSPQFLQRTNGKEAKEGRSPRRRIRRSDSRGANVRWKDLNEIREFWKKDDTESEEDDQPRPRSSREDQRSSGSDRERRRVPRPREDRDRDTDREIPRPRLVQARRSSSHDAVPKREDSGRRRRDRDRDRDRDRERYTSPVRGVDGRRYPPGVEVYR